MKLNFNAAAGQRHLLELSRYSTSSFDHTNISAPSGTAAAASSLGNISSLTTDVRRADAYTSNAKQAQNIIDTAAAALSDVLDDLQFIQDRVGTTYRNSNAVQRPGRQADIAQKIDNINKTVSQAEFGDLKLLNGDATGIRLQVGASAANETVAIDIAKIDSKTLSLDDINVLTVTDAMDSQQVIQDAINTVHAEISALNQARNTLNNTVNTRGYSDINQPQVTSFYSSEKKSVSLFENTSHLKTNTDYSITKVLDYLGKNTDIEAKELDLKV